MQLEFWQLAIIFVLIGYLALCFGLVAKRYGRNPWLWGVVSVLSPVNLIVLGNWALVGRLPGRQVDVGGVSTGNHDSVALSNHCRSRDCDELVYTKWCYADIAGR